MVAPGTTDLHDRSTLGDGARRWGAVALAGGVIALAAAVGIALATDGIRRFNFAYLVSFAFVLSISIGAIIFILIQHVTRSGWSVNVRRVAETLGAGMVLIAILAIPIAISVLRQKGDLYPWAKPSAAFHEQQAPAHHEDDEAAAVLRERNELILVKRPFLNPISFTGGLVAILGLWSMMGIWYWRTSIRQDESADARLTARMQAYSAPALVLIAITLTLGVFALLMSLDPAWYSTIFGVYYFAGAMVGALAAMIIILAALQSLGRLRTSVTAEHYHDLGKLLFAFVFFWGYIAFSQYMLIWYGNIPEETIWFRHRGATTVAGDMNPWTAVSLLLLLGHLLIPFAGLLARSVKRRKALLVFWAAWMLVFHWIDLYWLVMPELDGKLHLGPVEVLSLAGILAIWLGGMLRMAAAHNLVPHGDPRAAESLAFENV